MARAFSVVEVGTTSLEEGGGKDRGKEVPKDREARRGWREGREWERRGER